MVILRAICGMLVTSLLLYQKFNKDLKSVVFLLNNYYPFVEKMMFN